MDSFIDVEKKRLCLQLSSRILDFISLIDDYTRVFEVKDFYTFSSENDRSSSYKNEYRKFIISTAEPTESISATIAEISSLLITADRDMDSDSAEQLRDIFESYLSFEAAFGDYKKETERILSLPGISVSALLSGAKKIKLYIMTLLEKAKQTEA